MKNRAARWGPALERPESSHPAPHPLAGVRPMPAPGEGPGEGEAGGHLDAGVWLPVPLAVFREGVGGAGSPGDWHLSLSWPQVLPVARVRGGEGRLQGGLGRPARPLPLLPPRSARKPGPFWVLLGPSGHSWHRSERCVPRVTLSPKLHVLWPWAGPLGRLGRDWGVRASFPGAHDPRI